VYVTRQNSTTWRLTASVWPLRARPWCGSERFLAPLHQRGVAGALGEVDMVGAAAGKAGSAARGLLREPLTTGGAPAASALPDGLAMPALAAVAELASGKRKRATASPPGLAASVNSFWLTDWSTKPGASSAPTLNGRGAWPSTAIKAVPRPLALAITPITLNRSAGLKGATCMRVGAPSSVAMTAAGGAAATNELAVAGLSELVPVPARTAVSGKPWRRRSNAASVQYAVDSSAAPTSAAVVQRRPDSLCQSIMCRPSSISLTRNCKLDLKLFQGKRTQPRSALHSLGFTLIELMVVLVIIGVLAALIVPNVLDRADDARVSAARTDVNNIMQSLRLYRLDNQRYPTTEQGLKALVARPDTSPLPTNWKAYLERLPNDPWGQPYAYVNPGVNGEIDVLSYGADGKPGGEGKDADVGSWQ
jgi:general secretion pathway protein G